MARVRSDHDISLLPSAFCGHAMKFSSASFRRAMVPGGPKTMIKQTNSGIFNEENSIRLTKACIVLLYAVCAVMSLTGPRIVGHFMTRSTPWLTGNTRFGVMLGCGYACGVLAFVCLTDLYRLLGRIGRGDVFVAENVASLRRIGLEFLAAACITAVIGVTCYLPVLVVSAAAAFMMLIIRVVRNAFGKAVAMKDELDYTI